MRQKKRTIAPQEMWDPAAIERWLEEEARKGWRITDCGGWFAKFERMEPRECRVRIQYFGPESKEAWQERIAVYKEMGWQFAVALGMDFEVYYCDDPTIPELDTDPEVFAMAWQEPLRKSWRNGWMLLAAMLLVVLIVVVPMLIMRETPLQYLLEAEFRMLFVVLVIVPVFTVMTVLRLRQIYQARKKLLPGSGTPPATTGGAAAAGGAFPSPSCWPFGLVHGWQILSGWRSNGDRTLPDCPMYPKRSCWRKRWQRTGKWISTHTGVRVRRCVQFGRMSGLYVRGNTAS